MDGLFGIGPLELMLVFFLALIFIGPGKMPEVAASLGKAIREFQRASAELTEALNAEIAASKAEKAAQELGENGKHSEAAAEEAQIVAQGVTADVAAEASADVGDVQPAAAEVVPPETEDVVPAAEPEVAPVAIEEPAQPAAPELLDEGVLHGLAPLPSALLAPSISPDGTPVARIEVVVGAEPESQQTVTADSGSGAALPMDKPTGSVAEVSYGLEPLPSALLEPSQPASGTPERATPMGIAGVSAGRGDALGSQSAEVEPRMPEADGHLADATAAPSDPVQAEV